MSRTYSVNPLRNLIAQAIGIPSPSQQEGMPASLLGQLLLAEQQATAGIPDANRAAADTLTGIAGGGTANETPYGGVGPQGAPSTGNPLSDIPNALSAFGTAVGGPVGRIGGPVAGAIAAANALRATNLPGFVVGTMLGQAPGIYGSVPAKGPGALGAVGATHGLRQLGLDLYNAVMGYPSKAEAFSLEGGEKGSGKPDSLSAEEAAAQAAQAAATGDIGGAKDGGTAGTGAGAGSGAGAPGGPSGTGDEDNSGGFGAAKQGGLATERGFLGPEHFAQGGQVIELQGGGKIAIGPGGGLDDLIPTSINGRRAAALSDGEFVIPADVVSMLGDGSSNAGSRRLYDIVRQIRQAKTGTSEQAGPLPVGEILKRAMS